MIEAVAQPTSVESHEIELTCSIGIALAPTDGSDADTLLSRAQLALHRAKSDSHGHFRFYEVGMDSRAQMRWLLAQDLRKAALNGEFELHYQPLLDLATNRICGCEALLRWPHPERGLISPADFIPLAEESGLILTIGKWVLNTACEDATRWPDHVKVAVNISPLQFRDPNFRATVLGALATSGLPPHRLDLEITETALIDNESETVEILRDMRALGLRISMDDFGTGYSSLSYLHRFPFDKIKIDQSFIRDLDRKAQDGGADPCPIIRAITQLADGLGMRTTAEGVETEMQLAWLTAIGCTEAQGYLLGRPMQANKLASLMERAPLSAIA